MKRLLGSEKAQTTAEFVMITPFLLLMLFLIVDFGWMLKNWIVVTNSAREAARCAVSRSCTYDGASVSPESLALTRLDQGITGNLSGKQAVILYIDQDGDTKIGAGDSIVVCIKGDNHYISPVLPMFSMVTGGSAIPDPLPIAAREEMRLELPPTETVTASPPGTGCIFP